MSIKWIGAGLIVVGCGGFGFMMAIFYQRELALLRSLEEVIRWMICELEYRKTPLPELIREAAGKSRGRLKELLLQLSGELAAQILPDAMGCMEAALRKCCMEQGPLTSYLRKLGRTLGEFDLLGQISSLQAVLVDCRKEIEEMEKDRPQRLRSYQTLGLCAGAALAILFV